MDENGTLSGSALDMASAVRNTVAMLGRRARPGRAHGEHLSGGVPRPRSETGTIAAGYRANLVLVDDSLNAVATWIAGSG